MTPNIAGNRPAAPTMTEDQSVYRRVRLTVRLGGTALQVFGSETGVLRDSR